MNHAMIRKTKETRRPNNELCFENNLTTGRQVEHQHSTRM